MASMRKVKGVWHSKGRKANRGRKPAKGKPLSDFKRNKLRKLFG
ncbi:MAG TPA: hypothetical protein VL860_13590 [Planctomycetota bacterium]|jgi:hypothetical protein|nr:hypothetical protein [Planctomycetota bacterium]